MPRLRDLARRGRLVAGVAIALLMPGAALADTGAIVTDCAPPPPIDQAIGSADAVFVGAVTSIADNGRSATVAVKEVWRGDLPATVTVNGGADPTNPAEDDRIFEVAAAYLFIPILDGDHFVDGVCSSSLPWSDKLIAFRPPDAHGPDDTATLGTGSAAATPGPLAFLGSFAGPLVMAALVGGGAFGFALLVAHRRDA